VYLFAPKINDTTVFIRPNNNQSIMQKCYFLFLFLFLSTTSIAQNKLETFLHQFVNDPELEHASISFSAIDIKKNRVFAQRNPQKALIPASSMKVITTGSAIAILGKDYKFKTLLEYSGQIKNGVLDGNLYICGTGDPSLASPIMEGVPDKEQLMQEFVQAIQKKGIRQINGAVIGDGSYFESRTVPPSWQWGDIGNHYGAGVSGLNYHDNLYYIYFKKNKSYGATPEIDKIVPKVPYLKFDNQVTSAGSRTGDNAYVYVAPYGTEVTIRGTIPRGYGTFDIKGAVPNPELLAADQLHNALEAAGVAIQKRPTTTRKVAKEKRTIFHTHYSPTLLDICKHTNEESRNMYCEALVKTIGKKLKGEASTSDGVAAIKDFWRGRGLDMKGFFMKDGSGLSARSGVTTKTMAEIMRKLYIDKKTFGDFYNQLAIAGQTGTLKHIGRNSSAEGNVHAKSGSMNRIRSYTGYVTTKSGTLLSFSVIVNNYSCSGWAMKKKLEKLMIAMAETQ